MRPIMLGLCLAAGLHATDLYPISLNVALVDSVKNPDQDSVTITMQFGVRSGATKAQAPWTATHISVDGSLVVAGGVDSLQVLANNTSYTYKVERWVEKKPFSIAAIMDPYSESGETPEQSLNNLMVRQYDFRPNRVRKDTVYTGVNCVPEGVSP